ncbi:pyrroline-5-carboxylate reductase [Devosia limi DSM 17137]|uniref:Pyrroline-5-carboxylate reductase n=1 Tax=Devosia limi DSM 17137 TaxID=1121477 RepID=A0A0F5LWI4_9HYPH|nr:pyrroline-5-carboxylate reductase [Devosia limi]KKB86730.1 pyrroline-5-carboxylate reductase [Devosia limi DSM 17137]SHF66851.1 pyrroline-5-carboxylate reductase [Devosia limi DSM 17137]
MSVSLRTIGPVMLVGAGKMGLALARGWLDAGLAPSNLVLVDPSPSPEARALAADYELPLHAEGAGLLPNVLVLAVKPQIIDAVMETLQPVIGPQTLVVSIAAGIDIARLTRGMDSGRVVRTMPNTPAQIGKGVTGAVAGPDVDADERATVDALLAAAGMVVWLDSEGDLDALTGVSGSGPAYVFNMVEAMAAAGVQQGLSPEIAMKLARQTVIGAAALMEAEPAVPAETLRKNVTSPNGTTAAALAVLMADDGLTPLMERAVAAARKRTEELGRA